MDYRLNKKKRSAFKIVAVVLVMGVILLGIGVYASRKYYFNNLKPVSNSQTAITVEIPSGSSVIDVAKILKDKKLIRSDWAFKQYVLNNGLADKILAGTYSLTPSEDVQTIVKIITEGKIKSNLFTIKPGYRLDQIKQDFINSGYDAKEVEKAFEPSQYEGHPALVDKPVGVSLEGYLYPESFQRTADTTPQQIIKLSLDEMQKRLTPAVREGIVRQGININKKITVHEGIILASIINQEVSKPEDKVQVAQVFLKRLKIDMALQSDATAIYGAVLDGKEPSIFHESLYNTYSNKGLPPGPISNVNQSSLEALVNPANTDWLYFVSGDDGKTYFSKTNEEHERLVKQYCKKLCNQ